MNEHRKLHHSHSPAWRSPVAGLCLLIAALLWGATVPSLRAKVYLTTEEALELAFPESEVTRETAYLTDRQRQQARERAGVEIPSALVVAHVAHRGDEVVGTAYFDTHRVRTLPETIMVVVDPAGKVVRIEVLSFQEPEEYLPRDLWYGQFQGKKLNQELALKRQIRGVTGATLTSRATTEAVRRTLALHEVLQNEVSK